MNWLRRQDDATQEIIESGREALAELHVAADRLNTFVAQLEVLIAAERQRRHRETDGENA